MEATKKIGIIGGMGAPAGAWLYQRIIHYCDVYQDQHYPDIICHNNAKIPDRTRAIVKGEASPLTELIRTATLFNDAKVDALVMACMTAYYFKDNLQPYFDGIILDPVQMVAEALQKLPVTEGGKIGLIGSTGLLSSKLYHERLGAYGYEVINLEAEDQEKYFMQPIYMKGGIKSGNPTKEVKVIFLTQLDILKDKGARVILGACSEVPLVITTQPPNVSFIDVFDLLAYRTARYCYTKEAAVTSPSALHQS